MRTQSPQLRDISRTNQDHHMNQYESPVSSQHVNANVKAISYSIGEVVQSGTNHGLIRSLQEHVQAFGNWERPKEVQALELHAVQGTRLGLGS